LTSSSKKNASYSKFISFELGLTIVSALLAVLGANYLYPIAPALFQQIAALVPAPLSPTGYAIAYVSVAGLIWIVSNSLLFLTGLRKL
jgi:hypothetical protein